ncbi:MULTISPECIES: antitoxin [unclassified Luteococcus]|uniref:antitoxin n=1 Tax=unclassified Luteococcus TaxID=2639923 RepID=UPI00313E88AA
MVNINDLVNKAEELAKQHPDEVRKAIDAVEDQFDARTGGKYSQQVDQAGNAVEGKLGLPEATPQTPAPEAPAQEAPTQEAPAQETPAQADAPEQTEPAGAPAQTADQQQPADSAEPQA